MKKTIVLGATPNPERYAYLAIKKLKLHNIPVVAVGNKKGEIEGIVINNNTPVINDIHTVSIYLGKSHQVPYYDYILKLKPQRLIFNPGAENDELKELAESQGISTIEACTLVLLSTGQY